MTICYVVSGDLVCETPLHIGYGRRTGFIRHTLPYIPGSFLRGALGILMVRTVCRRPEGPLKDHSECEFSRECMYARLFGEHEKNKASRVVFRFAYPVHEGCGGRFLPAPMTLRLCEECGRFYEGFDVYRCEECGKPLKPFRGFVCEKCGERVRRPVKTSRVVSTAIDRRTHAAAKIPYVVEGEVLEEAGTLHAMDVIERGSVFRFEALIDGVCEDLVDGFMELVEKGLPDEGIGGSASRGVGKVYVRGLNVREV